MERHCDENIDGWGRRLDRDVVREILGRSSDAFTMHRTNMHAGKV
jgi:hypothetical protein